MIEVLLESWDRQARMIASLASLVDNEIKHVKPSEDGWTLDHQLAHIHEVRYWWLADTAPDLQAKLGEVYVQDSEIQQPIEDLDEIRNQLSISAQAVRDALAIGLEKGGKFGPYDHAVFFLQHMVWHEGYHAGLILLALRNAGRDPSEEWQEEHIWELWRGPEVY